jgi:ubiquinone/menaquinone biosynthesis C-methylase UbiE
MKPEDTVLDVGCQSGLFVHRLRKFAIDAHGVDISREAVVFCQENIPSAKFHKFPVEKMEFPNDKFDIVTSFQMMEHLQDPKAALKEMYRVCKKKLLFTTPIGKNLFDKGHLHFFGFYDIFNMVKEVVGHNNFTICRINKVNKDEKSNCWAVEIFKDGREE